MRLENSFTVRAPIDEVWAVVLDVERAAPCVPGARVLDRLGEDRYQVALEVALGSPAVAYEGQVALVEQEAAGRRAVLSITADGDQDDRAESRLELTLRRDGELTEGSVVADLSLTGAAAEVDVAALGALAERLIDDFARNLAALLGGGVPTVNGADPASSTARMPEPVGEMMPEGRPVRVGSAAAAGAHAEAGESAPPSAAAGEERRDPPPAPPPRPDEASWAGATRQAGATIERLRSPVGALVLALAALGAILGWRRHARRFSEDVSETAVRRPAPTD